MAAITDRKRFGELIRAIWAYESGSPSTRAALKTHGLAVFASG
jgi:hypothetical protein